MTYSTNNKILMGLIVLLLLANLATLGVFWMGRQKRPPMQPGGPAQYLITTLRFDRAQEEAYLQLVREHRAGADSLKKLIAQEKDHFYSMLAQSRVSDSNKIAAAQRASRLTTQMDLLNFDHFSEVRKICNPQQQQKFDSIIRELMRIMTVPGQQPGPPHGEGSPPDPGPMGPPQP
jgi:periplasmic protein CpxP/Spy